MEVWQSSTEDQRVLQHIEHGSAHQQTFFAQASISCLGDRALAEQAAAAAPQTVHQALPRCPANGPAAAAAPAAGKKAGHHPLATAAQTARNTTAAAEFRAKHPLRPQPRPQSQTAAAAELRTVKPEQTPAAQAAAPAAQAAAPAAQATAPAPKAAPAAAHAGQKRSAPEQASLRQGPSEEARRLQQQLSHVHAQQARNAASEAAQTAARAAEQTAHTKRNAQREAQCTELEKQAASEALVPQQRRRQRRRQRQRPRQRSQRRQRPWLARQRSFPRIWRRARWLASVGLATGPPRLSQSTRSACCDSNSQQHSRRRRSDRHKCPSRDLIDRTLCGRQLPSTILHRQ